MMLQGQLGQSQYPQHLFDWGPTQVRSDAGLLGNEAIQNPAKLLDPAVLLAEYKRILAASLPAFRLNILKRQKFTLEGRQARIAASLAALNAPQPIDLNLAQWKQVLEEIEDED
jgi:hypothetical protein